MLGNDQIEPLTERFLRGEAEQCGRGAFQRTISPEQLA